MYNLLFHVFYLDIAPYLYVICSQFDNILYMNFYNEYRQTKQYCSV